MEVKLTLNEAELKLLDEALVQLPFYKVSELIENINQQLTEQLETKESD